MDNTRSISISDRESKVRLKQFASSPEPLPLSFLDRYPDILAAKDLKEIVYDILNAYTRCKPVVFTFGAHVIKCGLSRVVCSLIREGIITSIATNGASVIHDVEIALFGHTSEDVEKSIVAGTFGTTEETITFVNNSVNNLCVNGYGYGRAIGKSLQLHRAPNASDSIFATAFRYGIPSCCHIAIGTDVNHMHESANGGCIGLGSQMDFGKLVNAVEHLGDGGVLLNFGSAVILPEVVFKAIAINRARGIDFSGCVMVDFDMNRHYRPMTRIVQLANTLGGKGYHITSHHELMLPLLGALVLGGVNGE